MFKGRRFQEIANPDKIVTVVDENGTWVTLDDNRNIKENSFLSKFAEYLEPDNFLFNDPLMESLAQQFTQQINLNTVPIVGDDGSNNITYTNPENPHSASPAGYFVDDRELVSDRAKRELLEKFHNTYTPPVIENVIDENMIGVQQEQRNQPLQRRQRLTTYVPPEESETVVKDANTGQILIESERVHQASYTESTSNSPQTDNIYDIYNNNVEFKSQPIQPQQPIEQPVQPPVEQPVVSGNSPVTPMDGWKKGEDMWIKGVDFQQQPKENVLDSDITPEERESFNFFKKFKKVYPIKIDVSFDEMIADKNYVCQTAMNFEGDVIKFYTKELMKKIWNDPSILEKQIYDNLKQIIMGEDKKEEKKVESKKDEPKKEVRNPKK